MIEQRSETPSVARCTHREMQRATIAESAATPPATLAQRTSLKGLALRVLARNDACNAVATAPEKPRNAGATAGVAPATDQAVHLHARLRRIAEAQDLDPTLADRLPHGEEAEYADLDDDQLVGLLACWRDDSFRERGVPAPGDTATAFCRGSGPVLLHPSVAALAPVVNGVPRVLGCPWCHHRAKGRRVPRPKLTCAGCRFFERDLVNPAGGQGRCGLPGVGPRWHFPHELHACADWRPTPC